MEVVMWAIVIVKMTLDYVVLVIVLCKLTQKCKKDIFLECNEERQILTHWDNILMLVVA